MKILSPNNVVRIATYAYVDKEEKVVDVGITDAIQLSNLLYMHGSLPVEVSYNQFEIVNYQVVLEPHTFYHVKLSNGLDTYIACEYEDLVKNNKLALIPIVNINNNKQRILAPKHRTDLYVKVRQLLTEGSLVSLTKEYLVSKPSSYILENGKVHVAIDEITHVVLPYYVRFDKDIHLLDLIYVVG